MKAHERIKNYIDTNGVSLELLFRNCGISRNTLGTMLTGNKSVFDTAFRITEF